eukprot:scaffold101494_cov42-Phaeocystis_antarctica.AAC.2
MPLRRCACCGLPAAQETQCTTCEAPQKQHDETVEPMLYGEPLAVVVCALLEVGRGHTGRGQELVAAWRTGGSKALTAASFDALAQARCARMTGTHTQKKRPLLHLTGEPLGPAGSPLVHANRVAAAWLLEGENRHAPESYALLYERFFVETCFDDPEQAGLRACSSRALALALVLALALALALALVLALALTLALFLTTHHSTFTLTPSSSRTSGCSRRQGCAATTPASRRAPTTAPRAAPWPSHGATSSCCARSRHARAAWPPRRRR